MTLTIFFRREFSFKGRDNEDVHGAQFYGFTPENQLIEFSAPVDADLRVDEGVTRFDASKAQEVNLSPNPFGGKLKWRLRRD